MAGLAIADRGELARDLASVLSPEYELFASSMACGMSYRASARAAGFSESHGFRIMQMPRVRARVEELLGAPTERIRAGIDAEFLMLRNRAANEDLDPEGRANVELRLKLLTAHARYRGWIVDRKQVASAKLDFGRMSRAELDALLEQELPKLDPAMQERIKRIAAGELDADDSESLGSAS